MSSHWSGYNFILTPFKLKFILHQTYIKLRAIESQRCRSTQCPPPRDYWPSSTGSRLRIWNGRYSLSYIRKPSLIGVEEKEKSLECTSCRRLLEIHLTKVCSFLQYSETMWKRAKMNFKHSWDRNSDCCTFLCPSKSNLELSPQYLLC